MDDVSKDLFLFWKDPRVICWVVILRLWACCANFYAAVGPGLLFKKNYMYRDLCLPYGDVPMYAYQNYFPISFKLSNLIFENIFQYIANVKKKKCNCRKPSIFIQANYSLTLAVQSEWPECRFSPVLGNILVWNSPLLVFWGKENLARRFSLKIGPLFLGTINPSTSLVNK